MTRAKPEPGDPLRAVAYLRVSTEEQRNGPKAQRDAIEAWAKRAGVTVVQWRSDHGVSGGTPVEDRDGLMVALEDLRRENAGLLVVAQRDRLARDVVIAGVAEAMARDAGARIVSADGVTAEDTPEGQLMRTLLDAFAQYERARIRARTKAARRVMRREGRFLGGALPYGYVRIGGELLPDDAEQAILSRIRALAGLYKPARIAGQLNRQGVPCRGRRWHRETVERILGRAMEVA